MTPRQLIIAVIRDVVQGRPIEEVKAYADRLPAQVAPGSLKFCVENRLGNYFIEGMRRHDVSPAYELYAFVEEETSKKGEGKNA